MLNLTPLQLQLLLLHRQTPHNPIRTLRLNILSHGPSACNIFLALCSFFSCIIAVADARIREPRMWDT